MISLLTVPKALEHIKDNLKVRRLSLGLTQEGLSSRSGVPLPTLRKFERTGLISLEAFCKIILILDALDSVVTATKFVQSFLSIDDILRQENQKKQRKKGWIK